MSPAGNNVDGIQRFKCVASAFDIDANLAFQHRDGLAARMRMVRQSGARLCGYYAGEEIVCGIVFASHCMDRDARRKFSDLRTVHSCDRLHAYRPDLGWRVPAFRLGWTKVG